jgi:hypothetical protein
VGETKTPKMFPSAAFVKAPASSPLACLVIMTFDEMVVGVEHAIIRL